MNQYHELLTDILQFGAMSRTLGDGVGKDDVKRERGILIDKIQKTVHRLSLEDQLRRAAAPTRLKASEVEALWMRTPYYMKPQAFAAAVQDAAGVP